MGTPSVIPSAPTQKEDGSPFSRYEMESVLRELWRKILDMRIRANTDLGLAKQHAFGMKEAVLRHWVLDEQTRRGHIVGDLCKVDLLNYEDSDEHRQFVQRLTALIQSGQAHTPKEGEGIDMSNIPPPPPPPVFGATPTAAPGYAPPVGAPPAAPGYVPPAGPSGYTPPMSPPGYTPPVGPSGYTLPGGPTGFSPPPPPQGMAAPEAAAPAAAPKGRGRGKKADAAAAPVPAPAQALQGRIAFPAGAPQGGVPFAPQGGFPAPAPAPQTQAQGVDVSPMLEQLMGMVASQAQMIEQLSAQVRVLDMGCALSLRVAYGREGAADMTSILQEIGYPIPQ